MHPLQLLLDPLRLREHLPLVLLPLRLQADPSRGKRKLLELLVFSQLPLLLLLLDSFLFVVLHRVETIVDLRLSALVLDDVAVLFDYPVSAALVLREYCRLLANIRLESPPLLLGKLLFLDLVFDPFLLGVLLPVCGQLPPSLLWCCAALRSVDDNVLVP